MKPPHAFVVLAAGLAALPGPARAEVTAIYTNLAGHPTAQVPGVPGQQFRTPLVPFLTLYGSADGQRWIFKAFTDDPEDNDVIVVGSLHTGVVVAQEGDPSPLGGLTYGFMDSDCGINNNGQYAFGNRLEGGPTTEDEVIFTFNGVSTVVAVREGDPAPGLFDPLGAGDELFGNSLNSAHMLADGTVGYKADQIQNIDSDFESALYHGLLLQAQEGTGIGQLAGGDIYDSFVALSGNTFTTGTGPTPWIVEADIAPDLATEEAVILTGNIALREGDPVPGLQSGMASIFAVEIGGDDQWYIRGESEFGRGFAAQNGTAIAVTGQAIFPGSPDSWTNVHTVNASGAGDFIVAGQTLSGDDVIVLNGMEVVARSGDPVNLGGAGPVTEAFLGAIAANDAFISVDLNDDLVDDREVYAFAKLTDELGVEIGDAFVVVALGGGACPWDCGDGNGAVDTIDFLALLSEWGMAGTACDFDGDVVDTVDFLALLANWGACP